MNDDATLSETNGTEDIEEEEKVYSKAEATSLIKKRLDRERSKYADYDELKKFKEEYERASQTDLERVAAEAREAGAREVRDRYTHKIAAAEIKAALTGVVEDPEAIVEDLNLDKFLVDDEVDRDAVDRLKTKLASVNSASVNSASTVSAVVGHAKTKKTAGHSAKDSFILSMERLGL